MWEKQAEHSMFTIKEHKRHLFTGNIEDSAVAAHAHQESHDIDCENTLVIDYDDDFSRGKSKKYY